MTRVFGRQKKLTSSENQLKNTVPKTFKKPKKSAKIHRRNFQNSQNPGGPFSAVRWSCALIFFVRS